MPLLAWSSLSNWPFTNVAIAGACFDPSPPGASAVMAPSVDAFSGWQAAAKSARSATAQADFRVMTKRPDSNSMWGGRFSAQPDQIMEAINASSDTDKRLAEQDIAGSKAHAAMLAKAGVISASDAKAIDDGL